MSMNSWLTEAVNMKQNPVQDDSDNQRLLNQRYNVQEGHRVLSVCTDFSA